MSIREGFTAYYGHFGFHGIWAICGNRLLGRPKEVSGHPIGIRDPIHIRLRTTDLSTYEEILLRGQYALDFPFSPQTIVDAGANIGMASIYFAHRYPEAKIFAIEAEASNFAALARNVRPYPAIIPIHAALWNRDGQISVSEPDATTGAGGKWGFITREGPGVSVRALTMHTLMQEMRIPVIDMAKIDIEGAEQEVFQDTRWLSGLRCLMIELHDRFRVGCTEAVTPVLHAFERTQRGETTFYTRRI